MIRVTGGLLNIQQVCENNMNVCKKEGKIQLAQMWKLISEITDPKVCNQQFIYSTPWFQHPITKKLIESM